jgi:hypothetical protein
MLHVHTRKRVPLGATNGEGLLQCGAANGVNGPSGVELLCHTPLLEDRGAVIKAEELPMALMVVLQSLTLDVDEPDPM